MRAIRLACLFLPFLIWPAGVCPAGEYDPLEIPSTGEVRSFDRTVVDSGREREIPLRLYLPPSDAPASSTKAAGVPVVLFSHGLGGNREGSAYLGNHWAARGYVAVFLQHPGSDDTVWKDVPLVGRMAAMQQAASLENFLLRVQDVSAVLDQLAKWNTDAGHVLHNALDLEQVGMSGHSFGARTTQAVAGQVEALGGARFADPRIKAATIMSPSVPRIGSAQRAFGNVKLPWLLMTGTRDTAPIGGQTIESRRGVYPALPAETSLNWCCTMPNIPPSLNVRCLQIRCGGTQITTASS